MTRKELALAKVGDVVEYWPGAGGNSPARGAVGIIARFVCYKKDLTVPVVSPNEATHLWVSWISTPPGAFEGYKVHEGQYLSVYVLNCRLLRSFAAHEREK